MDNKDKFCFVVAAPWPHNPTSLCVYAHGSEVHHGTMEDATGFLGYVRGQVNMFGRKDKYTPTPEQYGIYRLERIDADK